MGEEETSEIVNGDVVSDETTKKKKSSKRKWQGQEEFLDALHGCLTISKSKISKITKLCMKNRIRYKDIVHHIEKFIRKGKTTNDTKLPQLYLIHHILTSDVKESRNKEANQSKFIRRFGKNIDKTFHALCRGPSSDKAAIAKTVNIWIQQAYFDADKMRPIAEAIKAFSSEHNKKRKEKSSHHHKRKHKK